MGWLGSRVLLHKSAGHHAHPRRALAQTRQFSSARFPGHRATVGSYRRGVSYERGTLSLGVLLSTLNLGVRVSTLTRVVPYCRESSSLTTCWSESTLSLRRFGGPATRHASLNSLFQCSLTTIFQEPWCIHGRGGVLYHPTITIGVGLHHSRGGPGVELYHSTITISVPSRMQGRGGGELSFHSLDF